MHVNIYLKKIDFISGEEKEGEFQIHHNEDGAMTKVVLRGENVTHLILAPSLGYLDTKMKEQIEQPKRGCGHDDTITQRENNESDKGLYG